MLQELLLALHGIPGAIFVEAPKTDPSSESQNVESEFQLLSENLPLISPAELSLYGKLLQYGSCYSTLENFIQLYANPSHGMYLAALAHGFDLVLNDYRTTLVHLESDLLNDQDLNISHVFCQLHRFSVTLPVLSSLAKKVDQIYKTQPSVLGCKLFDFVLNAAPTGVVELQSVMRKLLVCLLRIFCRQLHDWLIYGVVHDPFNEFFIQPVDDKQSCNGKAVENSPDADTLVVSNLYYGNFKLVVERIPGFLSTASAHQVIFAGESVHTITRDLPEAPLLTELETLYGDKFNAIVHSLSRESEQLTTLYEIGNTVGFDLNPLQSLISEIRTFVSSKLWENLVKHSGLVAFLHSVRDVALLGRGELFLAFIDHTDSILVSDQSNVSFTGHKPVTCNSCFLNQPIPQNAKDRQACEYDIQASFLAAARSIGLDDEELDSRFQLTISHSSEKGSEPETLGDALRLKINIPASLRMVFSPQIRRGYTRLFGFLTLVKRTQACLQRYWAEQTFRGRLSQSSNEQRESTCAQTLAASLSSNYNRRLIIRNHMAFFVESLQNYLQVDVIESQFATLLNRIESDGKQVDLILASHETFVVSVQAQCLLFHPTASQCILRLLRLCRQFVSINSSRPDDGDQMVENIFDEFCRISSTLFQCLSCSESVGAKPGVGLDFGAKRFDQVPCSKADLSQLLLRLDFNHFYSHNLLRGLNGRL